MKQSILFLFLLSSLALTAQVKLTADSMRVVLMAMNPDSSAIGRAIGDRAAKTIGPEGGKIFSADSTMELTFPPGALTAPTEIGLQRMESTSAMNFGNAYACSPDGIHFQKPVQLLIRYADSAAKGISVATQTIRWQDKSGKWTQVEKVKADSATHSLTCRIEHFSGYAPGRTHFKLSPESDHVKIKQQVSFTLLVSGPYPDGKKYTWGSKEFDDFWKSHTVQWSVNGQVGGDDTWGRIKPFSPDQSEVGMYTAPAVVPNGTAIISAKYLDAVSMGDGSYADGVFSISTADIYDEFKYSFMGNNQLGHLHMIDSSSCIVRVNSGGTVELRNIKNPIPWSDWPTQFGDCTYTYPDKTGWTGMVQIAGMASGSYLRAGAPYPNARVLIQLSPTTGTSPRYTGQCKKGKINVPSMPINAQPVVIDFEPMADGNIKINYGGSSGINVLNDTYGKSGFSINISHLP
jgi:hypothetical protein